MKKSLLFLLVSFSIIHAQTEIKQITDFSFDVTYPAFPIGNTDSYIFAHNNLFFEIHNDDSSNIAALSYNYGNDSFENLFYLTRDSFSNKNPSVYAYDIDSFIAMWETNRNGNFDIAYSKFENGNWQPVQIATESEEDETEISFVRNQNMYDCDCALAVFNRNGSIIIKDILDKRSLEETIFTASGAITYSQPAAGYKYVFEPRLRLIAAAIRDSANVSRRLVYREEEEPGLWSEIKTVNLIGMQSNPDFDFEGNIIFDNFSGGKSSVYYFDTESGAGEPEVILSDSVDSYYNFKSVYFSIITKDLSDFISVFPFAAQKKSGAVNYVAASSYYDIDTSIVVSVQEPQPNVGTIGAYSGYYISYAVWVDSANGNKNLFGIKRLDPIGEVGDSENFVNGYALYQNFPNPFHKSSAANSTTVIRFTVPQSVKSPVFVELNVYDILGRKVAALVNERKVAGDYSVEFNGTNYATGVYLYSLRSGDTFIARKMILLK